MSAYKPAEQDIPNWLFDEAYLQRMKVVALNGAATHGYDINSCFWLIREEAWRELIRARDFMLQSDLRRKTLVGLPVRTTVDDAADTPLIQICAEPPRLMLEKDS